MIKDALGNGTYSQANLNVMSAIIDGIDITDIIDKISAISIVRCSRDGQESTLYEGLLAPIVTQNRDTPSSGSSGSTTSAHGYISDGFSRLGSIARRPNVYALFSPERMLYFNTDQPEIGDSLKINAFFKNIGRSSSMGTATSGFSDFVQKFYAETNPLDTTLHIGSNSGVSLVAGLAELDYAKNIQSHNSLSNGVYLESNTLYGYAQDIQVQDNSSIPLGYTDSYYKRGKCARTTLVETTFGEGNPSDALPHGLSDCYGNISQQTNATYVQYKKLNNNLYGGTTEDQKALNLYYTIGHYLPITPQLKADILSNGRYVLNGMQVFGGDCFITLFPFSYSTYDKEFEGSSRDAFANVWNYDSWQLSVVFPVQSSVNTALMYGNRVSKDRQAGKNCNKQDGLQLKTVSEKVENYNKTPTQNGTNEAYLTCYSTDKKKISFTALPTNFEFETEFDYRIRYSQLKNNGVQVDSFMIFPSAQFLDVEPNHGMINNVRTEANRLYYWQQHAVGSVPINERMVVNSAVGEMVNLGMNVGVGLGNGRFDERHSFYGNQHQHSLVKTTNGFCWYDFSNSAFIHMNTKLGINNDSLVKGYYQFFRNEIDPELSVNFNPVIGRGIVSGYDEVYRTVYMTFFAIDGTKFDNHTIAFNDITNTFIGEHSFFPTLYTKLHSRFITTEGLNNAGISWLHDTATSGRANYFGVISDSTIELIVNANFEISKIFDTFMLDGNDKFFYKIECWTNNQHGEDDNIVDKTTLELLSDNVEYRNQSWIGNFPLTDDSDRFTDSWLRIKFYFDNSQNKLIKLLSLQTISRQAR